MKMTRNRGPLAWFVLAVSTLFLVAPAIAAQEAPPPPAAEVDAWRTVDDRWYLVSIGGEKAGWEHRQVETNGQRYRTLSDSKLTLGRAGIPITIRMSSTFVETVDGTPRSVHMVQDMGVQVITTRWTFEGDTITIETGQGDRTRTTTAPVPGEPWLTPMAARDHFRAARRRGDATATWRTLLPEHGTNLVTVESTRLEAGDRIVEGAVVLVTTWRTTTDLMPIDSVEAWADDGYLVSAVMDSPFGRFESLLAEESVARAPVTSVPEMMISLLVATDRPIERSLEATTTTLRLRTSEGDLPALPEAASQRVEPGDDPASAILHVDVGAEQPASAEELADPAYLAASTMVDAEDALILALCRRAVGDVKDPMAQAEALRAFVHGFVTEKSYSTAFASASETARMRTGDCSEHGVLLCALLRSQGIPARVATGLVYVDEFGGQEHVFGWHMWTQALIDGRWVDFDATLPVRYTAGHILAATSTLAETSGLADFASMMQLMGNLEVEVLEVGYE